MVQDMENSLILHESSGGGILLKSLAVASSKVIESQWLRIFVNVLLDLFNVSELQDGEDGPEDLLLHDSTVLGWVEDEGRLNEFFALVTFSSQNDLSSSFLCVINVLDESLRMELVDDSRIISTISNIFTIK